MKPTNLLFAAAFLSVTAHNSVAQSAVGDATLTIRRSAPGLELSWPARFQNSDGSMVRPYFELQRSADLLRWQPMGERQRASAASPAQILGMTLGTGEPQAFYRSLSIQPGNEAKLGSGGAEVFGYASRYSGWYPQLFYRTIYWTDHEFHTAFGAGAFDGLVADVHTDVPCADCDGDPGSVLHEATGLVNLLMLAVDNGPDRFVCAGPVLSHYEFEVLGEPRRVSDEEWRGRGNGSEHGIIQGSFPEDLPASRIEGLAPPEWTRSYLVPAPL